MRLTCSREMNPEVGPTRTSRRTENSRPSANIRRMTPSSEMVWMRSGLAYTNGVYGPTITPAIRYPTTTGWRMAWKITVVTAATHSTSARSSRKLCEMISGIRTTNPRPPEKLLESNISRKRSPIRQGEDANTPIPPLAKGNWSSRLLYISYPRQDLGPEQLQCLHQTIMRKQAVIHPCEDPSHRQPLRHRFDLTRYGVDGAHKREALVEDVS